MSTFTRAKAVGSLCALALTGSVGAHVAAGAAPKIDAGDLKALIAGLALERTAIKTYTDIAAGKIGSPPVLAVLNGFLADHTAHRDAIAAAITTSGQQPAEDLAPLEVPQLATESDILNFVYGLERSLAITHLTALPEFKNHDYVQTTGSILGVETTHVALLAEALRKGNAYPTGVVTA